MDESAKQQLQNARKLIDNNQYTMAKRSLKRIDHPVATLWLKMLNHAAITTNTIITVSTLLAIAAIFGGLAGYAIADNQLMDTGEVLDFIALDAMISACARETDWLPSKCKEDMVIWSVEYGNEFVACYSAFRLLSDIAMIDCLIDLF